MGISSAPAETAASHTRGLAMGGGKWSKASQGVSTRWSTRGWAAAMLGLVGGRADVDGGVDVLARANGAAGGAPARPDG